MHASPFREILAFASTSILSFSHCSSDRNVLCPKASYQLASDDRRKKRLFCFAMDMNLHNRDLTQHNSYQTSLEVSMVSVPVLREAARMVQLSEEDIVVGCEEVLEGLN